MLGNPSSKLLAFYRMLKHLALALSFFVASIAAQSGTGQTTRYWYGHEVSSASTSKVLINVCLGIAVKLLAHGVEKPPSL